MITTDEIRKIAQLAHLEITDAEVELYTPQMISIVEYVKQLDELDTAATLPATGGLTPEGEATDGTRADDIRPSLGQADALKEAPDALAGHFRVPKIL